MEFSYLIRPISVPPAHGDNSEHNRVDRRLAEDPCGDNLHTGPQKWHTYIFHYDAPPAKHERRDTQQRELRRPLLCGVEEALGRP